MVDLDQLKASGRRAYELGRLRMAARVGLYLVPIGAVSVWVVQDREACGCLVVLLLTIAISARWKSGAGIRQVHQGLVAGTCVLVLAWALLAAGWLDEGWAAPALAVAGFLSAAWACRGPRVAWVGALVAALTASLGCVDLGSATGWVALALGLGALFARR
jgi:hypothetical protein